MTELGLVAVSDEERKEKLGDVMKIMTEKGFPMFLTSIGCVSIQSICITRNRVSQFAQSFVKWQY